MRAPSRTQSSPIAVYGPRRLFTTTVSAPITSGPVSLEPLTVAPSSTTTGPRTSVASSTLPKMRGCNDISRVRLHSSKPSTSPVWHHAPACTSTATGYLWSTSHCTASPMSSSPRQLGRMLTTAWWIAGENTCGPMTG